MIVWKCVTAWKYKKACCLIWCSFLFPILTKLETCLTGKLSVTSGYSSLPNNYISYLVCTEGAVAQTTTGMNMRENMPRIHLILWGSVPTHAYKRCKRMCPHFVTCAPVIALCALVCAQLFTKSYGCLLEKGSKNLLIFSCDEQLKKWRCHSVCVCVRVCIRLFLFFLLVSLKFLLVLKCFNCVSRLFKRCFGN